MSSQARHLCGFTAALLLAIATPDLHAAISSTGDVSPTYNGTDDPWDIDTELLVGNTADGSVLVDNGSIIYADGITLGMDTGTTGSVNLLGRAGAIHSSEDVNLGVNGRGTLTVENLSHLYIPFDALNIGYGVSGQGDVNLERAKLEVETLNVGFAGYGVLNIDRGAHLNSSDTYLAKSAGSVGQLIITGEYPSWAQLGRTAIGEQGIGNLIVNNDSKIESDFVFIGVETSSFGSATLSNDTTWAISDYLFVGFRGHGALSIGNGASVTVDRYTQLGHEASGSGILQMNQGRLETNGLLAGINELRGTGSIYTTSLVTDIDLVFDQTHGYTQDIHLSSYPIQQFAIHLDATDAANNGPAGAGYRSNGSLAIADGMQITSANGYLGYHEGAKGIAVIDGPGSRWDTGELLYIGYHGAGELRVSHGAQLKNNSSTHIGRYQDSTGSLTVTDPGSRFDAVVIYVGALGSEGYEGHCDVNVENGGMIESATVQISGNSHTDATITITDPGSTWQITGGLLMAASENQNNCTINIRNQGLLDVRGNIQMRRPEATINLEGGTLSLSHYYQPPPPRLTSSDDTAETISARITGGTLNFTGGRLQGANVIQLDNPFNQQGGTLAPGQDIGQTLIIGDATLTAGVLEIELGGEDNTHDSLVSTGDMKIYFDGMTLDLKPVGYIPAGDYTIMHIDDEADGSIFGSFGNITGLGMIEDLVDITYTPDAVTLTFNRDYTFGDFDHNGLIGLADLDVILDNWNQYNPTIDLTGDNYIGLADLDIVLSNWNQTGGGAGPRITIPEPATLLTITCATLLLMSTRRAECRNA